MFQDTVLVKQKESKNSALPRFVIRAVARQLIKKMYWVGSLTVHGCERCFNFVLGTRNAVKLAASAGNPSAAVAASAHPPVLWSSRRKPGKFMYTRIISYSSYFKIHSLISKQHEKCQPSFLQRNYYQLVILQYYC